MADQFQRRLAGFRFVEILRGDTLQGIAARELGDATAWYDLVQINGLAYPFITDDPAQASDKVKLSGQSILVPANTPSVAANIDPDAVFEIDCALQDGFLTDDGNGDFTVASGRANLRQALANRIVTEKGDLLFHPGYGCLVRRLLGAVNGPTSSLLAAQYVKSALKEETRIQNVNQVVATVSGDSINVQAEVQPVSGRIVDLQVTA